MDPPEVWRHRLNMAELTKNEIDFYLMGLVRASLMDTSDRGAAKRQRKRSSYSYMGKKVCLYAFLYLENITIYQLKKIRCHIVKHGVVNIQHGNLHKIPHNAFPLDLYKRTEQFLRNYLKTTTSQHERHSNKSIVLPQPLSKVYQEYKNNEREEKQGKLMGYTTFRSFFRKQFPHVKLSNQLSTKPSTEKAMSFKEIHCQRIQIVEEHTVDTNGEIINDYDIIPKTEKEENYGDDQIIEFCNTDDLIYYDDTSDPSQEVIVT